MLQQNLHYMVFIMKLEDARLTTLVQVQKQLQKKKYEQGFTYSKKLESIPLYSSLRVGN